MGTSSRRIELSDVDEGYLGSLIRSEKTSVRTAKRARILLLREQGRKIDDIATEVQLDRNSVMLCINKFKAGGVEAALKDAPGRGRPTEITEEDKSWIVDIACQRPTTFGHSIEMWSYPKLTDHIHKTAEAAGHPRLATINMSIVYKILEDRGIKL